MMRTKLFFGISLVVLILVLSQSSMVFAAKPVNVTFSCTVATDQTETAELEKKTIRYLWNSGTVSGDIEGTFSMRDTIVDYYDKEGSLTYTTYDQKWVITTTEGQLMIESNRKIVSDVPWDEQLGKWKITGSTEDIEGTHGHGTFEFFVFEGKIN